ncbi:MAG TPA: phosphatidate cytidylyltransferase [Bacteroidales bacterium]|nr:phosphatidate cytidylyltransferase [Bacteroidales bacterium]
MSNFLLRTVSGVLFVASIIGALIIGEISFLIVYAAVLILSMYEFYTLTHKARIKPQIFLGILIGLSLFIASYLYANGYIEGILLNGFIPIIMSIFIFELYRNHRRPFHNIAFTYLGILYIAIPISLFNFIVFNSTSINTTYSFDILLGYFFLIWANDTGAYLFGVSIGKHKLFPRISPKKSWEGFFGGIIFTTIIAWAISHYFHNITFAHWLMIGLISAIAGVFGDLVESMYKRSLEVKDSGKFLPGHGGILDRFDSIYLSAPLVFAYLKLMMLV